MTLATISAALVTLGELLLLITAYQITIQRDIPQVISAYRWQSFILTGTALLIALSESVRGVRSIQDLFTSQTLFAILLIALLPLALGLFIHWILKRATIYVPERQRSFLKLSAQEKQLAQAIWFEQRYVTPGHTGLKFLALILIAFAIVFLGIDIDIGEKLGISVSLTLHLVGLYNTFSRKDILTQVIGVLTMDQGLYLAIVKIVNIPVPATLFVVALYFYTIITIVILFLVVPQLRHKMGTMNLKEIAAESDLKG